MPTQAKRESIDMLAEALKRSDAVFITEYRGLTVKKISAVRKLIRQAGGEMKVCKNTLMRIALKECDMVQASEIDFGPNGYVLSSKETLIAQVVGTIAAPLRGLVTVLSGPQRNFVTVLERIKEQKESAA